MVALHGDHCTEVSLNMANSQQASTDLGMRLGQHPLENSLHFNHIGVSELREENRRRKRGEGSSHVIHQQNIVITYEKVLELSSSMCSWPMPSFLSDHCELEHNVTSSFKSWEETKISSNITLHYYPVH